MQLQSQRRALPKRIRSQLSRGRFRFALARSTLRAYQQRLRGFSEYACDRRYPWSVICEREFGRGPGQLFAERNLVAHLDEFEAIRGGGR